MKTDLDRLRECWAIPERVNKWTFVVNHPGVHSSLIQLTQDLEEKFDGRLRIHIWSNTDLTRQFLTWGRRSYISAEFGDMTSTQKLRAPLSIVPEDTALPQEEAKLEHQRLWARLTCNKSQLGRLDKKWLRRLSTHPYESMIAHTHLLIATIAAGTLEGAFDPLKLRIGTLQRLSGMTGRRFRSDVTAAWSIAMKLIMKEDYIGDEIPEISDDIEEAVVELAQRCIVQDQLMLALIRLHALRLGKWETDVLEEIWSLATEEIKLRD